MLFVFAEPSAGRASDHNGGVIPYADVEAYSCGFTPLLTAFKHGKLAPRPEASRPLHANSGTPLRRFFFK